MIPWVLLSIVGVLVILAILAIFVYKNKGEKYEPDYRLFFILGITWLPIGIASDNPGLWGMGAVMMIAGLANRDKWKEQPKWSEMDPEIRRLKLILIIGLTLLLVIGIGAFLLLK